MESLHIFKKEKDFKDGNLSLRPEPEQALITEIYM